MATSKTKKNTSSKKNQSQNSSPFVKEIAFVVVILCCILILLSFFHLCGVVGEAICHVVFGLFGMLAYIFPILLLLATGFYLSNPNNSSVHHKIIYGGLMYIDLIAIVQWCVGIEVSGIWDFYSNSSQDRMGGGLFGGLLSYGAQKAFGTAGSIVILAAILVVLFILFSKKMIFASLREVFEVDHNQEPRTKKKVEVQKESLPESVPVREKKIMQSYRFPKESQQEEMNTKTEEALPTEKATRRKASRKRKNSIATEEPKPEVREVIPEAVAETPSISIIRPEEVKTAPPVFEEEMDSKFGKKEVQLEPEKKKNRKKEAESLSQKETEQLHKEMDVASHVTSEEKKEYQYPSLDLLNMPKANTARTTDEELIDIATKLQTTLESFGVRVKMGDVSCGPSVTRFELMPDQGVKVSRITSLADDIKLSLAASDIRIEAPIPGKAAVGIEVPNRNKSMVTIRELLENKAFQDAKSKVSFAVGKDIAGKTVVTDISKMPHLLVAGATGSGKSVCINTLIMSILFKASPDEVKLILIDPKQVEFQPYNDIPHLMIPVVTDPKKASAALSWAVNEMTKRYQKFVELGVRDMKNYNKRIDAMTVKDEENFPRMPQIVIIVDEFADLMMVAPGEVEDAVCRLAQLARAAGIHLVLATQRPSVNVITGLIKANIPSRIALSVSSAIDSRTIIDSGGAEKLLGNGDMLFAPGDYPKPVRVQGAFVSDKEVERVVEFLKGQFDSPAYNSEVTAQIDATPIGGSGNSTGAANTANQQDELFVQAAQFIIEKDKASIGMLQRVFRIGFNRAARIMDQLADAGVVGPEEGTKPRRILMSEEQFENYLEENG